MNDTKEYIGTDNLKSCVSIYPTMWNNRFPNNNY